MTAQQDEARNERFGYVCRAYSRCCTHKIIQVNPYEIARHTGRAIAPTVANCTNRHGCGALGASHAYRRLHPLGHRG